MTEFAGSEMAKGHKDKVAVITGMLALAWIAGGLGIAGLVFMGIGLFAPHAVHFV